MRTVAIVTPSETPFVSLDDLKAYLRVDFDDDDVNLQALLDGAIGLYAPPLGRLGRALALAQFEVRYTCFPRGTYEIGLPFPPLVVDDTHPLVVSYVDVLGTQTLAADTYRIDALAAEGVARLSLASGRSWPSTIWQSENVRIRFWAGYAADDKAAAPIRLAVKMLVRMHYEIPADKHEAWRRSIADQLAPFRVPPF